MNQPMLSVVLPMHMSLYPTMDTMVEAIKYIEAQVPVVEGNDMFSLLMIYHNTLIKTLKDDGLIK